MKTNKKKHSKYIKLLMEASATSPVKNLFVFCRIKLETLNEYAPQEYPSFLPIVLFYNCNEKSLGQIITGKIRCRQIDRYSI